MSSWLSIAASVGMGTSMCSAVWYRICNFCFQKPSGLHWCMPTKHFQSSRRSQCEAYPFQLIYECIVLQGLYRIQSGRLWYSADCQHHKMFLLVGKSVWTWWAESDLTSCTWLTPPKILAIHDVALLIQSVLMILAQLALLYICIRYRPITSPEALGGTSTRPFGFWQWTLYAQVGGTAHLFVLHLLMEMNVVYWIPCGTYVRPPLLTDDISLWILFNLVWFWLLLCLYLDGWLGLFPRWDSSL